MFSLPKVHYSPYYTEPEAAHHQSVFLFHALVSSVLPFCLHSLLKQKHQKNGNHRLINQPQDRYFDGESKAKGQFRSCLMYKVPSKTKMTLRRINKDSPKQTKKEQAYKITSVGSSYVLSKHPNVSHISRRQMFRFQDCILIF